MSDMVHSFLAGDTSTAILQTYRRWSRTAGMESGVNINTKGVNTEADALEVGGVFPL